MCSISWRFRPRRSSISERRTDRFLDVARNRGLPAFLAGDPGVDSGFMIAQYTAAGIVSEMKRNAVPASVDSIPSSAMQEDHVSMGWAAARKLRRSIPAFARVLAVELLCSCRSFDFPQAVPSGCGGRRRIPRGAPVRQRNRPRRTRYLDHPAD